MFSRTPTNRLDNGCPNPLCFSHGFAHLLRRHEAFFSIYQSDGCTAKGRITTSFVAIDMGGFVAHDFIPLDGVGSKCNGVDIVPDATNRPASFPNIAATRS